MSMLDHSQWLIRQKAMRIQEVREVLKAPWAGDQQWEGKTIGLHLPLTVRDKILELQDRHDLRSMKETIFKALTLGIRALDEIPQPSSDARTRFRRAASNPNGNVRVLYPSKGNGQQAPVIASDEFGEETESVLDPEESGLDVQSTEDALDDAL